MLGESTARDREAVLCLYLAHRFGARCLGIGPPLRILLGHLPAVSQVTLALQVRFLADCGPDFSRLGGQAGGPTHLLLPGLPDPRKNVALVACACECEFFRLDMFLNFRVSVMCCKSFSVFIRLRCWPSLALDGGAKSQLLGALAIPGRRLALHVDDCRAVLSPRRRLGLRVHVDGASLIYLVRIHLALRRSLCALGRWQSPHLLDGALASLEERTYFAFAGVWDQLLDEGTPREELGVSAAGPL